MKICVIPLLAALAACGGGGGGDRGGNGAPDGGNVPTAPPPPAADPFGLAERVPLAAFDLPAGPATLGTYELVNRFPNLRFAGAIFLAGIPGDDRLVVLEQGGRLLAFENDRSATGNRLILDLSGEILVAGEQGFLGLAFDPDFVTNRFLYVHYSMDASVDARRRSVIARFSWDAVSDTVDPASRRILLELEQPFVNHNGGMLAFGPDGHLYIAFGDGGSGGDPGNRAQDLANWFGTLLRIDVNPQDPGAAYSVPPDNPYVADPDALDEIWAHGLRNPFRFSFDRGTGELWLGDVGQNANEEINLITRGGNYGWRVYEGNDEFDATGNTRPRSAFTFPVHSYATGGGAAVIGGYVYRGNAVPSLRGRYLYADFATGQVWALTYDGVVVTDNTQIAQAQTPTSFGEDNAGEVYLVTSVNGIFGFEESAGGSGPISDQLSETGLFTDVAELVPAPGLIEYELNQPFWSDGAFKRRWIGVPDGERIGFSASGAWDFPSGTVIVKHFELALTESDPGSRRRLETRVLVNTESDGWRGFTYRWNSAGTAAALLTGRDSETITVQTATGPREQRYEYPSQTDCLQCHTGAAGGVLGVNARQLNRARRFEATNVEDNQLRAWNHVGLFDRDIGAPGQYADIAALEDTSRTVTERARAWLDVNCAHCHRPDGPTPTDLDLRLDTEPGDMNAIAEMPQHGDLGIAGAAILAPGDRTRSVLWLRIQRLDDTRMPPLTSHVVDGPGAAVIGDWIDAL